MSKAWHTMASQCWINASIVNEFTYGLTIDTFAIIMSMCSVFDPIVQHIDIVLIMES